MFVQDQAETLIGRDKELQLLLGYASGTSEAELKKIGRWVCIRPPPLPTPYSLLKMAYSVFKRPLHLESHVTKAQ